jgi:DNA polymerase-3 subunit delta'
MMQSLPWTQPFIARLSKLAANDKLGHAYLLQGPKGIGKHQAMMKLAAHLFCQNKTGTGHCGSCQPCHLFAAGTHPDFLSLMPEEGAKQIKIEQIRNSQSFIGNTPLFGKYKILLIEPAENLNINAANALLKNLEEPAAGTLFFLVSHQPGALLATIRSRCQQIKFAIPESEQALEFLKQSLSQSQAQQALALSRGAPLKALALAEENNLQAISGIHQDLLDLFNGRLSITDAAAQWDKLEDDILLESLLTATNILSRCLQVQNTSEPDVASSKALSALSGLLQLSHASALHEFYQKLIRARMLLQSRANPNRLLLLESLCLQWVSLLSHGAGEKTLSA